MSNSSCEFFPSSQVLLASFLPLSLNSCTLDWTSLPMKCCHFLSHPFGTKNLTMDLSLDPFPFLYRHFIMESIHTPALATFHYRYKNTSNTAPVHTGQKNGIGKKLLSSFLLMKALAMTHERRSLHYWPSEKGWQFTHSTHV